MEGAPGRAGLLGRKAVIDRGLDLPIERQAEVPGIARGTAYYAAAWQVRNRRRIDLLEAHLMALDRMGERSPVHGGTAARNDMRMGEQIRAASHAPNRPWGPAGAGRCE